MPYLRTIPRTLSPSVPEEDSQATKKTSVIVNEEKSLHTYPTEMLARQLNVTLCLKTWTEIVNS